MPMLDSYLMVITHTRNQTLKLVADLSDTGLVLSGGSALLPGLPLFFQEQLGIPVRVAKDPLRTVVRGAAICIEHLAQWKDSLETNNRNL